MTDIDTAALRAAAEAATPGRWVVSGPDGCLVAQSEFSSWGLAYVTRNPADAVYIADASPAVVLALLDQVDALRAMQERVAELATEYDHYLAFLVGVGARPRNDSEVHDAALAADQLWEALEGSPSTAKERWELGSTDNQQGPQIDAQEPS